MEKTFKFNLADIMQEVNGEPDLIPYWVKLHLLDYGIPIEVDPLNVKDPYYDVSHGVINYFIKDNILEIRWTHVN